MEDWRHDVPAILMAWYSGMEGGAALADVLLGDERARRPAAVRRPARRGRPAAVRQERHHGDLRPVARPAAARPGRHGRRRTRSASACRTRRSRCPTTSRSAVDGDAVLTASGRPWRTPATGPGGHVVQVYATRPDPDGVDRSWSASRGSTAARGSGCRWLDVPLERLATWQGPGRWAVRPGTYRIDVGASAADPLAVPAWWTRLTGPLTALTYGRSRHERQRRSKADRRGGALPGGLRLGHRDRELPDRGRCRGGRSFAVDLGHVLAHTRQGPGRGHRRRRRRPLPPLQGGHRADGRARRRLVPLLAGLAAPAARRARERSTKPASTSTRGWSTRCSQRTSSPGSPSTTGTFRRRSRTKAAGRCATRRSASPSTPPRSTSACTTASRTGRP